MEDITPVSIIDFFGELVKIWIFPIIIIVILLIILLIIKFIQKRASEKNLSIFKRS